MPTKTYPPEEAAVIDRMKAEILADIGKGMVSVKVKSYSELHDYVDANEYGGACEVDAEHDKITYQPTEAELNARTAFWNRCQGAVDEWLKTGGHRRQLTTRTYKNEFGPGYLTPEQAAELTALGLEDTSWHNDACPRFATPGDGGLCVWLEHEDQLRRPIDGPRYAVCEIDATGGNSKELFVCSEFPTLVEWLKAWKAHA